MILKDLIAYLEKKDPDIVLPHGFSRPHSYRGYYEDLAFEPAESVRVGDMLRDARSALVATYEGYKGGSYRMGEYTDCWLAQYGSTGDALGTLVLDAMFFGEHYQSIVEASARLADAVAEYFNRRGLKHSERKGNEYIAEMADALADWAYTCNLANAALAHAGVKSND